MYTAFLDIQFCFLTLFFHFSFFSYISIVQEKEMHTKEKTC